MTDDQETISEKEETDEGMVTKIKTKEMSKMEMIKMDERHGNRDERNGQRNGLCYVF